MLHTTSLQCISDPPENRDIKDPSCAWNLGSVARIFIRDQPSNVTTFHAAVWEAPRSIPGLLQPICLGMVTWFLDVSLHSSVRFRNLEIPTRRPQPSGIVTSAVAARSSDLRKQICLNRYSWTHAFSIQRTRLNPFKSLSQLYSRELAHRNGRIHWYEDKTDKTSIWFYLKWESELPILLPWPGRTSKSTGLSLHLVQKS